MDKKGNQNNESSNLKNMKRLIYAAFAVLFLAGCDNALNSVLENAFYLNESSKGSYSKIVLNETDGADVTATVRCGKRLEKDVTVKVELSQKALDDYNRRNGTSLVMLPQGTHDFEPQEVVIPAGSSLADVLTIHVDPFSEEMISSGKKYALPVTITKVSDGTPLLSMKSSKIYAFEQVIITSGFRINPMSQAKIVLKTPINTNTYTVELRVAPMGLGKENEAFLMLYPDQTSINESQGQVYCRFQVDNSINVKVLSNEGYTWAGPVTTKWYHMAIVSTGDGNLVMYVNGSEVQRESKPVYADNNLMETVSLGSASSTWHTYAYCYSEVRLWSVARTESQIADNMYAVDPKSEGLVAYWRCNEGEGTVIHDVTGNGNDMDLTECVSTELSDLSSAWQWIGPVRTDTDDLLLKM